MKKLVRFVLILAAAAALLFLAGRYGWRIWGFRGCDTTKQLYVEDVSLSGDTLTVTGGTFDSMSAYVGHIAKVWDGRLYLGVKHNLFLGFFRRLGGFSVSVSNGQEIGQIYLIGSNGARLVWTRQVGLIRKPYAPAS